MLWPVLRDVRLAECRESLLLAVLGGRAMTRKEWKIRMAERPATYELRSCDVALAVARAMRRNDERVDGGRKR
jgi:hypothetical protein